MKKQLLAGAFVLASFLTAQAQVLESENFNDLNVGDLSTDTTGQTPGQGDYYTLVINDGDSSDFQVVANGKGGTNGLQITGASVAQGTTQETDNARYLWKNGLADAWAARTSGNDIISAEFDLYASVTAGTANTQRIVLYNDTYSNILGGFVYYPATGELRGIATYTGSQGSGNYTFTLKDGGLILNADTWYRLAIVYAPSTGAVAWASNDIIVQDDQGNDVELFSGVTSTNNVGLEPAELDILAFAGTANTVAASVVYDNFSVKAIATPDEVLGVKENVSLANLSVYPNPANDVVNVSVDALVSNVAIVDLNGRTVKTVKFDGVSTASVNVSDLASGVYMATITSDKGTTTKKIVKN